MSSWRPSDQNDASRQLPNVARPLPTSLFYQMEHLLDNDNGRDRVHFEDMASSRSRDIMINRPIEQSKRQEDIIDKDCVLASCVKETHTPYNSEKRDFTKNHQEECSICLERFEVDERLLRLPCSHLFHVDCVLPWIMSNHDNCPLCRAKVVPIGKKNQKLSNIPLGSANNGPQSDVHSSSQHSRGEFNTTSRDTPTNNPIHILNVHLNRDSPPRITDVPPQIANLHSLRFVSTHLGAPLSRALTNPYSTSPQNNDFSVPTRRYRRSTIRDIHIAERGQLSNFGAFVRDIPISHHRPHHYPQTLLSRGGYTNRHGRDNLASFENEEATSAILARLSLWI